MLYLVSFFSFQNQKKARRVYVVYTFADTHAAPIRNESSSPAVIESPGRTDRDISAAGTDPDGAFSCTTSSLIYCNSFNVLSFRFFSETLCKVNTFFRHGQILMRFLTFFLFQPRYSHPKAASAGLSSEKRVQSYNLSTKQPNLLCTFLKKYHGKTIQNNTNS